MKYIQNKQEDTLLWAIKMELWPWDTVDSGNYHG